MASFDTTAPTPALAGIKVYVKHQVSCVMHHVPECHAEYSVSGQQLYCRVPLITLHSAILLQVYISHRISHRAAKVKRWQSLLPGLGAQLLEV